MKIINIKEASKINDPIEGHINSTGKTDSCTMDKVSPEIIVHFYRYPVSSVKQTQVKQATILKHIHDKCMQIWANLILKWEK